MKFPIQYIEKKLENFFENNFLSFVQKDPIVLLTEELVQEFEHKTQPINGKMTAPNNFLIRIRDENCFENKLAEWEPFSLDLLTEVAKDSSIGFLGPLRIEISIDNSIVKDFQVSAEISHPTSGDTINLSSVMQEKAESIKTFNAYLILWNEEIFEISKNVINIGRQADNDLVIDNLRVSRTHAQIRKIKDDLFIFDADSVSGTFVNGKKINQHLLSNGDVIEIADVPLIISIGEKYGEFGDQKSGTKILKTNTSESEI